MDKREVVLTEFQGFINWLYEQNAVKYEGTRFGYQDMRGEFTHAKIRDLENQFIEFLRERGYYSE